MSKIVEFYRNLNKKKRITFWVCVGIIFLTIVRVSVWSARKDKTPTTKTFIKQLKSQNKNEKIYGIYNVGNLKIKEALPELEELYQKESDEEIKRVCAWSIGQIDFNKLLTYLDSSDKKTKEITFETILKIDKKNINYLIDRFDKEDIETKFKILDYISSSEYQDKLLKIVENEKEEIPVRKKAIDILKEKAKFEDVETYLWALYYREQNDEMKNYVYHVINEMKKRSQK
ncbi:MAG: hypothetical protein NC827_07905 [Candidatus Omnitrophica bacterium]|nr:hypothetical protein [Candidatus Omnitrophota bacterium]MCM8803212.1 hypothetical protein [Candidatus Omnitrophota bacterium]